MLGINIQKLGKKLFQVEPLPNGASGVFYKSVPDGCFIPRCEACFIIGEPEFVGSFPIR